MSPRETITAEPVVKAGFFTAKVWWALAAITLLAGYADLWRGGETLAPVLLVLGYCVLVPIAILR